MSVSVHPALAASVVNDQIETSVADLGELAELTDLNDLSEMAIIQDNQISSVTLDEIDLDTKKDLSTAPQPSLLDMFLAPSSAATDGDDEMMYIDRGLVHIHARDPLSDQSSNTSSLQSQLAGISVLPPESPVLTVPCDDVELSRIVSNLTDDGYIFTGMSAHQYQSTVTSEKFRSLNKDQLAVAGIHVSDASSSTITAQEDVTYYTFMNPATEFARVVTAAQLIGADGVTLMGDRKVVVSPIVEKSAMDSQRGDNDVDLASWILDLAMMCPGVLAVPPPVVPLPVVIGIIAIVGIILLIIYLCTHDSPPSPAPQTTIVQFGNLSAFTHQPNNHDYTRIGGDSAIRRTGELETYHGTGPKGKDWIQATHHAAITRDGNLVKWSDGQQEPTTIVAAPGKKYVAVSQYSDWLLAIYEDTTGSTHLEPLANPAEPPSEIRNAIPTATGWKKISAGPTHALALRADDTLVAWGQNDYGQLNLPIDLHYTDIAAGSGFSIGLAAETRRSGTPSLEGSTILAAGKDDNHQVSDAPKETDYYLKIAAGENTAATLTHDGHIKLWGRPLEGAAPPTDGGCTDIAIGLDSGLALQETAPEKQIDRPVGLSSSGDGLIPYGSTIERSDNTVTRVLDPSGSVAFWVNDKNTNHIRFPAGAVVPVTRIHYVPSRSLVDCRQNYTATVVSPPPSSEEWATANPNGDSPSLTITETAWYDDLNPDNPQTLPRAMCFADTGCSVGVTTKQHLFLSDNPIHPSTNDIPSLSVHQLSNTSWIGTIHANNQDRSIVMEKNHASPDQPLYFSIISSNGGYEPGQNVVLSVKANLMSENATLRYTVTGISSSDLTMYITPNVWKITDTSDVLVYSGPPVTCLDAAFCAATGTFTPPEVANYFTNATILYTVPTMANGAAGTQQYAMTVASAGATRWPWDNQAINIEGTDEDSPTYDYYRDIVQYAKDRQKQDITHSSLAELKPSVSFMNDKFPGSAIFFFNGHGSPGRIYLNSDIPIDSQYCANGCPGKELGSKSAADFVMFMSCESGKDDPTYGNLVTKAHDIGATCVFGYKEKIDREGAAIMYGQAFWSRVKEGTTWNQAHDAAIAKLKDEGKKYGCSSDNSVCGYDTLKKEGVCDAVMIKKPESDLKSITGTDLDANTNEFNESLIQPLAQARSAIRTFTGIPDLDLKYTGTNHASDADIYKFTSEQGSFSVNSVTGRVQGAHFSNPSAPSKDAIDLEHAYTIAETYAKQKYPELLSKPDQNGVKNTHSELVDRGDYSEYMFEWRDKYPSSNTTNSSQYIITGLNSVAVTMKPNGAIVWYYEHVEPIDPNLSLIPDLTEEQAWKIAEVYYASRVNPNVVRTAEGSYGLTIFSGEDNNQHLVWRFNASNERERGGKIWVDAHDGKIILYMPHF